MSIDRTQLLNGPATVSVGGLGETFDIGSLGSGVSIQYQPEFLHWQPQQASGDVKSYKTREGFEIGFTVWEPTLKNIDYFMLGGDGTYAGGSANEFGGDDTPEELAPVVIYGTAPDQGERVLYFNEMIAVEPGAYVIDRFANHGFEAKLKSHSDPLDGTIGYIDDP